MDCGGSVCRRNHAEQSQNDPFVQTLHLPEGRKPEPRRLGRPSKSNQQRKVQHAQGESQNREKRHNAKRQWAKIAQTLQIGSNAAGQAQYSRFCAKTQQLFVKLVFYEELCLPFSRAFRLPLSAAEAFCKFFIS